MNVGNFGWTWKIFQTVALHRWWLVTSIAKEVIVKELVVNRGPWLLWLNSITRLTGVVWYILIALEATRLGAMVKRGGTKNENGWIGP